MKHSHYQNNFKSFKIKDIPNTYLPFKFKTETDVYHKNIQVYEPIESYEGQFRNSHSVWYKPKLITKELVLQPPWKNKLIS